MEQHSQIERVTWKGWLSLLFLIVLFSGAFANAPGFLKAFDLGNLVGKFGNIFEDISFQGKGGVGARAGFLFALSLIPTTALSVGLLEVAEEMGAMRAATRFFHPLLKPLMGISGTAGITFVASFTSSDIGAVMTRDLVNNNFLTDDERTIFISYQYAGSAVVLNTIGTQAPLLPIIPLAIGPVIVMLWICKIIGANMVRFVIYSRKERQRLRNDRDGNENEELKICN